MPRALDSLPAGAAVLVVDAESSDGTAEVARARGARVIVRRWDDFVSARRFALAQAETPWVFMLDADEALDATLRAASAIDRADGPLDGYAVRRTTYFCGRPISGIGWGDEKLVRLVRASRARVAANPASGGEAALHERLVVDGPVGELAGTLLHDSYPTVAVYFEKFARYTSIEARDLQPSVPGALRALAVALVRAPYLFTVRGGWRDGWRGAFLSVMSAAYPAVARFKALLR